MNWKGIDEITNILDEFLEPFGLTAVFDSEFAYYPTLNEIHYTIFFNQHQEDLYNEFVRELQPELSYNNSFILSLLHELGHNETRDQFSKCKRAFYHAYKDSLLQLFHNNMDAASKVYFRMTDERTATEWGLDYLINHFDEMNALWDRVYKAIVRFYKSNNVE